jgi:tetratricopeptide (TPR) repeat protein
MKLAVIGNLLRPWKTSALRLCRKGDYAAAENVLRQCLEASQARQHDYFIARCVGDLGLLAYYKEQYQNAEQHLIQALDIWTDLGHEPYIAWVQCQLGHVLQSITQNRSVEAGHYYKRALQLSVKHNLAPIAMDVFTGVAELMIQIDTKQNVIYLLSLIESHPASTAETRKNARKYLADLDVDRLSDLGKVVKSHQSQEWQVTAAEAVNLLAESNHR